MCKRQVNVNAYWETFLATLFTVFSLTPQRDLVIEMIKHVPLFSCSKIFTKYNCISSIRPVSCLSISLRASSLGHGTKQDLESILQFHPFSGTCFTPNVTRRSSAILTPKENSSSLLPLP